MNRAELRRMERDLKKTNPDPLVGTGFRLNVKGNRYRVRERRELFDLDAEVAISDAIHKRLALAVGMKNIEQACKLAGVGLDDAKALLTQFALECQPVVDVDAAGASMKRVMELMEDKPTDGAEPCRQALGDC